MAPLPVGPDHDTWPLLAERSSDFKAISHVFSTPVSVQGGRARSAKRQPKFSPLLLPRASSPRRLPRVPIFALCQVESSGAMSRAATSFRWFPRTFVLRHHDVRQWQDVERWSRGLVKIALSITTFSRTIRRCAAISFSFGRTRATCSSVSTKTMTMGGLPPHPPMAATDPQCGRKSPHPVKRNGSINVLPMKVVEDLPNAGTGPQTIAFHKVNRDLDGHRSLAFYRTLASPIPAGTANKHSTLLLKMSAMIGGHCPCSK